MAISVIDPVTPAFERMKLVCFKPFSFSKWLTLGFCAFLATCDQQGVQGPNFNYSTGRGGPGGGPSDGIADAIRWAEHNAALLAAIVIGVLVLIVAFSALAAFLGSRGKFMFLDGVVHNRGEVVRPWNDYAHLANSFFKLRFALMLLSFASVFVPVGLWFMLAWGELRQGNVQPPMIVAAVVLGLLIFFAMVALGLFHWLLVTLIVPIMYQFDVGVGEALRIFRHDVMRGNVGAIILFCLFQIVLGLVAGIAMVIVMCLTCCVAALPYISCVVFLPVFVFFQCYDVYFLQQFGTAFRIFDSPGICSVCGYDLRGSAGQTHCPECGAAIGDPDAGYQPPAAPPTSP
jgi:hypothetical protein